MSRAVCGRCGAGRTFYAEVCTGCGFLPEGEGLSVAWLLSDEYLDHSALDAAAARIRAGETIQPTARMLKIARKAIGQHFATDPGLSFGQRMLVLGTSLLLTPLVGLVLWWTWRSTRPRAAWQAFALSAPASVAFFVLVLVFAR